jgi:glutamate-1-semialdehyde 2,1-aminomutase
MGSGVVVLPGSQDFWSSRCKYSAARVDAFLTGDTVVPETRTVETELLASYIQANPRSLAAYERASRLFPGGVTHDSRAFVPFLPYVARAEGAHKWDLDGHDYVDYAMGHGALILGHAHPSLVEAVTRQVRSGTHPGANHILEVEWAERVHALVPGAEMVRFTSSGTEATLLAIRLARAWNGRRKLAKFQGHFHGWHDAVTRGQAPPYDDVSPGVTAATANETVVLPVDLDAVGSALARDPEIAAAIIEPSGAGAGAVTLPEGFLHGLRALTAARQVVLILDEVVTGFRWSPGGAQQRYGVRADLVTLAKILAGGLPGGAVAGRRDLLEPIAASAPAGRRIRHQGTFNANPLSAASGIACLDIIRDGAVHAKCDAMAEALRKDMNACFARRGIKGVAHGEASRFTLAFDAHLTPGDPQSLRNVPGDALKQQRQTAIAANLTLALLLGGVHLMGLGGFLSTAHTRDDIDRTVDALDRALALIGPLAAAAPSP